MIIRKENSIKEKISEQEVILDYPVKTEETGFSIQELNGRVPDERQYRNRSCNEICFVVEGKGEIFIDDSPKKVDEGDIYFIKPGQKSYIKAEKLEIFTITQPNWYKEQCETLEDEK